MAVNIQAFLDTLPIMGKGMLGIFIVTAVIVGVMYWLQWTFKDKKK